MPRRTAFKKNNYYHCFNRGLNKQLLFFYKKDYLFFIKKIKSLQKRYKQIKLLEYTLMPNHFHFIIKNLAYWRYISRFIEKLTWHYSKYIGKHYGKERWKTTFEGRFKAKILKDEKWLQNCRYYVALNPIKDKLVKKITDRKYRQCSPEIEADINITVKRKKRINCQDLEEDFEY